MADLGEAQFDKAFKYMERGISSVTGNVRGRKYEQQPLTARKRLAYTGKKKVEGFDVLLKNLNKIPNILSMRVARTLGAIVVDLLTHSQPRTPVETGELRESGTAIVRTGRRKHIVGKGSKDGHVGAQLTSIDKASLSGAKSITADVSYSRFNEKGQDVAMMMHELIAPFEDRESKSPAAKTPGTGPKYLEIPWLERRPMYEAILLHGMLHLFEEDIKMATNIRKRTHERYMVDVVEITQRRISNIGYFGNR